MRIYEARQYKEVEIYWTPGPANLADIFTKEDKDIAHFEAVQDQMVMPRESFRLTFKAKSWGVLEQRLDNHNYDCLTKTTKRKEETKYDLDVVSITDEVINTDMKMNDDDNINDNDNNRSNEKIEH